MEQRQEQEQLKINLFQLGCKEQTLDFYSSLGNMVNEMDILDRTRIAEKIIEHLFSKDVNLPPIILALIMEKLQSIEVKCATWKNMLGKTVVKDMVCKKCQNMYPAMTLLQLATGINSDCPHNQVEITFDEETSLKSEK